MSDFDAFNAPQFFDFSNPNEQEADYFDDDSDVIIVSDPADDPLEEAKDYQHNGDETVLIGSDPANNPLEEVKDYEHKENGYPHQNFRRSMSVGDISYLQNAIKNNYLRKDNSKSSSNTTGSLIQPLKKQFENKLTLDKRQYGSHHSLTSTYVPMAEAIRKFHVSTPDRFHTRAKSDHSIATITGRLQTTVPQSPHFISNTRNRPIHILTHEEKELQEFQEAQKCKFKAHPVDKKILLGPSKLPGNIEKKSTTVVEPFNFAPVKPKIAATPPKKEQFQAKPVPDFSLKPKLKKPLQCTKAQTPTVLKRYQKKLENQPSQPEPKKALPPRKKSAPLPFSFEVRNNVLLKKREAFIAKFIEEEKKAREFYAQPIPKGVLEPPKVGSNSTKTVELRAKTVELKSKYTIEENLRKEVKLRPSTDVSKKPLTEIQEFKLSTDLRAKERKAFEEELKAKQDQKEDYKRRIEERKLQEEKEEIRRLRKMAEVKAQPIRKYKEVVIAPSGKITDPISPKFYRSNHLSCGSAQLEDNKENSTA